MAKFAKGFEKVAVSVGFINKLTDSGMRGRISRLAKHAPEKLHEWSLRFGNRSAIKKLDELAKKSTTVADRVKMTSPHASEIHYKDFSQGARDLMRAAFELAPPKIN